ncbi:predicted protein [Uncinocarpus reesii 1704]|uniref:Uncharacterized protein n=1 Tax=Uncinocarpus reesii (strain UAMH 1704) TaxID=336963 RepID=C4JLZ6_UNCRE|nr:uncharacterized protein UREG_03854 [Uncinocarpus reesii 1704]EEP79008.1 predicted protein [Uncinocarpus reesii 1704]
MSSTSDQTAGLTGVVADNAISPERPIPTMKSPIDGSVLGYAEDKPVHGNGVKEMAPIVELLENAGVSCCMVAEPALIYYGAGRVMTVFLPGASHIQWIVCVPVDKLVQATEIMLQHNGVLEPYRASALRRLSVYAQSLLETLNLVDLDDLVDGMDLTTEWGETNLKLDGTADAAWGRWRADFLNNGEKAEDGDIPQWCFNPPNLLEIWQETTSPEAKQHRQGWKYHPRMATRFRRHNQKDPRLRTRLYC